MNDIERLAAAIRKNQQDSRLLQPVDENWKNTVEMDMRAVSTGKLATHPDSDIERATDESNATLNHDIATDFGLNASSQETQKITTPVGMDPDDTFPPVVEKNATYIEVPIKKLTADGFITPLTGRGLLTEQYRRIKRPLLKNIRRGTSSGPRKNVIMVTSSVSGEGKTFTSINLAMSLATERERSILLVDADVVKNTASGVLKVRRGAQGLTDLLAGDVKYSSDVILKTNINNFEYLPSGTAQQDANELLSSDRMRELFDELSSRDNDRIIVLDCPPILQTNEASVITDYAGQVVFVVAEEETSQSHVTDALKQIPNDNYVGIVLNKSRKRLMGSDYGYSYEYG